MTSPTSPPNRRRRRIVFTIAALVLGLGWWIWPRVDQRFVGTWRLTTPRSNNIDWELERFSFGSAYVNNPNKRLLMTTFSWRTEGDTLQFASHNQEKGLVSWVKRQVEIGLGKTSFTEGYEIVSVRPGEITLREEDTDELCTLTRYDQ
jgi:hypothetical protein